MRLITRGTTRLAIVVWRFAIKIPRPWPLRRLRKGLISNRLEKILFEIASENDWHELCPVILALPFGIANIMPLADPISVSAFNTFFDSSEYPDRYPDPEFYEHKPNDWGLLGSRPVVVDYAAWVQREAVGIPTPLHKYMPGTSVRQDPIIG